MTGRPTTDLAGETTMPTDVRHKDRGAPRDGDEISAREDAVAAARTEAARLLALELDLAGQRDEAAAAVPALEAAVGGEVLDGGDVRAITARVAEAKAIVEALDQAIATARDRRGAAIRTVFEQEAGALFAEAAAKRAVAAARAGRTAALLAELEEYEGIAYVPVAPDPHQVALVEGRVGGELNVVSRRIPITDRLIVEAEDLERRAQAPRDVTRHGYLEADSLEELIAGTTADPMIIGPAIASTRAWAAAGLAAIAEGIARAQARHGVFEAQAWGAGRPVRFRLYWGAGEINTGSSSITPVPQEPLEYRTRVGRFLDRASR